MSSEEDRSTKTPGVLPQLRVPALKPWTYGDPIPQPRGVGDILAYAHKRGDGTLRVDIEMARMTEDGLVWSAGGREARPEIYALAVHGPLEALADLPGREAKLAEAVRLQLGRSGDIARLDAAERRVRRAAHGLASTVLGLLAVLDEEGQDAEVAAVGRAFARYQLALDSAGVARALAGDASDLRDIAASIAEAQELGEMLEPSERLQSMLSHLRSAWVIAAYLRVQAEGLVPTSTEGGAQ
jgi:hypothetical protein